MNEILKERFFKLEQELELADAEIAKLKAERQMEIDDRASIFWSQVMHGDSCWEWVGWREKRGYGQMHFQGKMRLVHRIAAFLSGMLSEIEFDGETCVLHHCDNPPCCRPEHLFIGTQQANIEDMNRKGRQVSVTGDKHHCSKLTESQFEQALTRAKSGESIRSIANSLGVKNQSLFKRIKRHNARLRALCGERKEK